MIGYKRDLQDDTFYCDFVLRDVFQSKENGYGAKSVVSVLDSARKDFYIESVWIDHFLPTCFEV